MSKTKKISISILIGSIGIFTFLNTSYAKAFLMGKNIKNDSMSERSKEFIKDQKDESELWNNANFMKRQEGEFTVVNVDDCFTINIPYQVTNQRKDAPCDFHIAVTRPKASIIAYVTDLPGAGLNEDSGVRLRRRKTDKYSEYSYKSNIGTYLIFKHKVSAFERNAFLAHEGKLLVVNVIALVPDDLTNDFHEMLNSVQFNPIPTVVQTEVENNSEAIDAEIKDEDLNNNEPSGTTAKELLNTTDGTSHNQ
jgi:hypothetical protein